MSFPTGILLYVVLDLSIINLLVFYWLEKLSLIHVVPVIVLEIVALAVAMVFLDSCIQSYMVNNKYLGLRWAL
jgi:hypothetical protein